jgi:hypothetical protein
MVFLYRRTENSMKCVWMWSNLCVCIGSQTLEPFKYTVHKGRYITMYKGRYITLFTGLSF